MEPKPSLKVDWDVPLSEVKTVDGKESVWHLLYEASRHQHNQDNRQSALLNLKFITTSYSNIKSDVTFLEEIADPFSDCACANFAPFSTADYEHGEGERLNLRLTEAGELDGCNHYVALSYCWQQLETIEDHGIDHHPPVGYNIETIRGVRMNRAPPIVIHRAIRYAAAYGFRLIWIDQECIEQDDVMEKQQSIQSMHLIYRQAKQTVALLTSPVLKQPHLDIFDAIGSTDGHKAVVTSWWKEENKELFESMDFFKRGIELTEILANDRWFSRAWTLQESLVAGGPLHFLIPCHSSLHRPKWLGPIPQQLVLSESFINTCLANSFFNLLGARAAQKFNGYSELCFRGEKTKNVLLDAIPAYKMSPQVAKYPQLARLSALDACNMLLDRGILESSDLIAILGNLCQYQIRLDTSNISGAGLSFSICALALSLLNGDISLFLALEHALEPFSLAEVRWKFGRGISVASLSEGSNFAHKADISNSIYLPSWICRIQPAVLTVSGPLVAGTLWSFDDKIDFVDERELFEDRWKLGQTYDLMLQIFYSILGTMQKRNHTVLAKAVFTAAYFRSLPSYLSSDLRAVLEPLIPDTKALYKHQSSSNFEWWLVRSVMEEGIIHIGSMGTPTSECSKHEQTFVLLRNSNVDLEVSQQLFVPRRVLAMDEVSSAVRPSPESILSWWTSYLGENDSGQESLELLSSPTKLHLSKEVLYCGSMEHFYECEVKNYLLMQDLKQHK
ncbi:heterokaryon incompatibility protein-domain-containing protein [Bisporella sp. PMI_857]|nr:heterokaryon incompatibility protein-domain-containing protein [Bisporella sp. PMI_857]